MTDAEFQAYIKTVDSYDAVYFGNHGCDPNTASVNDERVALRDIAAGEELTIDYAKHSPKTWSMRCHCGAKNCTGIVRGKL